MINDRYMLVQTGRADAEEPYRPALVLDGTGQKRADHTPQCQLIPIAELVLEANDRGDLLETWHTKAVALEGALKLLVEASRTAVKVVLDESGAPADVVLAGYNRTTLDHLEVALHQAITVLGS